MVILYIHDMICTVVVVVVVAVTIVLYFLFSRVDGRWSEPRH